MVVEELLAVANFVHLVPSQFDCLNDILANIFRGLFVIGVMPSKKRKGSYLGATAHLLE